MGAEPGEAYVVLGVPADLDEDGCLELLDGIAALAAATGTTLAGGDVTRAPALTLAITVVGHAAERRSDSSPAPGRAPATSSSLTGELGGAAAGLLLLERPERDRRGACDARSPRRLLIARQLEPRPRLAAGRALAAAGATAMIDLSDGLGGDARAPRRGERGRAADRRRRPAARRRRRRGRRGRRPRPARAGRLGRRGLRAAGGAAGRAARGRGAALAEAGGMALTRIGEVVAGEGVEIRLPGGGLLEPAGFDQLA